MNEFPRKAQNDPHMGRFAYCLDVGFSSRFIPGPAAFVFYLGSVSSCGVSPSSRGVSPSSRGARLDSNRVGSCRVTLPQPRNCLLLLFSNRFCCLGAFCEFEVKVFIWGWVYYNNLIKKINELLI